MPETLYLTTNLIDRYLSINSVSRKNLQLVGVTAMLLAAKYEEIWAPEVQDFVFISDNAYSREQVLTMEKNMLNSLKFNLTVPTPYVFMVRLLKAAACEKQVRLRLVCNPAHIFECVSVVGCHHELVAQRGQGLKKDRCVCRRRPCRHSWRWCHGFWWSCA